MSDVASPTMSAEDMEKIMKDIEQDERAGVPLAPLNPAMSSVVTGASTASPLSLREFVNPEQLKRDVEFNIHDLDNEVMRHAGLFVYYANQARLARRQFERMKAACEVMESRLDAHWRAKLMEESGKKASEAQIESSVKGDARWFAAQNRLIDARAIYEFANDAREAFMQRKDMIIQVSVDRRREKEGQLRAMDQATVDAARQRALDGMRAAAAAPV